MTDQLTLALAPPAGNPPPSDVPPDVLALFEELALKVAKAGFKQYSARAVLHRIRWHHQIDQGNRDFKCNNNWTARMARWFLKKHPELPEFFETRNRKKIDAPTAYSDVDNDAD